MRDETENFYEGTLWRCKQVGIVLDGMTDSTSLLSHRPMWWEKIKKVYSTWNGGILLRLKGKKLCGGSSFSSYYTEDLIPDKCCFMITIKNPSFFLPPYLFFYFFRPLLLVQNACSPSVSPPLSYISLLKVECANVLEEPLELNLFFRSKWNMNGAGGLILFGPKIGVSR